jgi:type III pantothenate kinase
MLLLIDAGNSFIKLAYHDGSTWREQQQVGLSDFAAFAEPLARAMPPSGVIVANVAGDRFQGPMQKLLATWDCPARWITAAPAGYGIVNGYAAPEQLGADRWAALVGLRCLMQGAAMVVSIGTAVTIDVLTEQGHFSGGFILPGLALMREVLAEKTAGVGAASGAYAPLPDNTADAVYSGTLFAVAGAVEKVFAAQHERAAGGAGPELFITGGGAEAVAPFICPAPRIVPNLVLEGLLHIAHEERML